MNDSRPDPLTPFEGRLKVDKNGHLLVDGQKISVKVDWWITASAVSGAIISLLSLIVAAGSSLDKLKKNFGIGSTSNTPITVEIKERVCREVVKEVVRGKRITRTIEKLPCEDRLTKVEAEPED